MKVLVTRPRDEAESLAATLAAHGIQALIEPLLTITLLDEAAASLAAALIGAQALLFTSANGVRSFTRLSKRRDIKVLAVGDTTARAARSAGFPQVESAGGDVDDLIGLSVKTLRPAQGPLVHAAGVKVAGDLAGRLREQGFDMRRIALYTADPAKRLSSAVATALRGGEIGQALFFSPRTAESFVDLIAAARLSETCAGIDAVALSPAVAAALSPIRWRAVRVAASPTQRDLLAALDAAPSLERSGA